MQWWHWRHIGGDSVGGDGDGNGSDGDAFEVVMLAITTVGDCTDGDGNAFEVTTLVAMVKVSD